MSASRSLAVWIEHWPLKSPFRFTGCTWTRMSFVVAMLQQGKHAGRGEAVGVHYRDETTRSIMRQIEDVRPEIEAGADRDRLQTLLPAGGARNAVDCALWDLEAKTSACPVWQLAGLDAPKPLVTTLTLGTESPERMASAALALAAPQAIKLKLTGESADADRVRAVREAQPNVWLGVDANQGFTRASLELLLPVLLETGVALIEQPFKVGQESQTDGLDSPIPLAADESAQTKADLERLVGRFDVVNIKLDKAGGLTEALDMARTAQQLGLEVMVGNLMGTALAMAPACLVGQLCKVVDLDGAIFLEKDRMPGTVYDQGTVWCPDAVWG